MAQTQILVVENEIVVAEDIRAKLRGLGYAAPAICASGDDAIERSGRDRPDLVLMDIDLPGPTDGVAAATRIRERFNIPVVYLTAYADPETVDRAKVAEPYGYILKPFEVRELHSAVQIALYKHRMEQAVRESEQRLRAIFNAADNVAMIMTDLAGADARILEFSPGAQRVFRYTREEAIGKPVALLHLPEDVAKFAGSTAALRGGRHRLSGEATLVRKSGERFPALLTLYPILDSKDELAAILGVSIDITERKEAEEAIGRSREQLRALAAHIESVREEERTRLARKIHDDVGHALTALKMDLSWLARRLGDDRTGPGKIRERMKSMSALLDRTIRTTRETASALRPGLLDDLGLAAAMEWEASQFAERSGIRCECDCSAGDVRLDHRSATALFRICQELLTNVARHAEATEVRVTLTQQADHLVLEVRDNGKGITEEQVFSGKSLGILGMRERALLVKGELCISGADGEGTAAAVRIPLDAGRQAKGR